MTPDPVVSEQPSMTSAVERVLSASQQLVVDRIDLLFLEAKEGMSRGIEAAVVAGVAVGVFFCGWLCINASLAVCTSRRLRRCRASSRRSRRSIWLWASWRSWPLANSRRRSPAPTPLDPNG